MTLKKYKEDIILLEDWLIGTQKDHVLMQFLKEIVLSEEISLLKRRSIISYFNWITPEYINKFIIVFIINYIFIFKPELVEKILSSIIS